MKAKIQLTITINQRNIIYTITNVGIVNLCNDFILCSRLFGKTCITNEYLSYGESVSVTKNMNDIKFPMIEEFEKAAVFTLVPPYSINTLGCAEKGKYIMAECRKRFQNGNAPGPDPDPDPGPEPEPEPEPGVLFEHYVTGQSTNIIVSIYNSIFSEADAVDVNFIIPFNGPFTTVNNLTTNTPDIQLTEVPEGLQVYIPLIKVRESKIFSFSYPTAGTGVNFSWKINTSSRVLDDTEYVNFLYV